MSGNVRALGGDFNDPIDKTLGRSANHSIVGRGNSGQGQRGPIRLILALVQTARPFRT
jgi:hypothetical protein